MVFDLEQIEWFVQNYGYIAVLLGAMVEGESIILTASMFASRGLLSIQYVALITFLSTTFADQLLFLVGKRWKHLWGRFEQLEGVRSKVHYLVSRYPKILLLTFRFVYGIRTITPIIVGSIDFPVRDFCILNIIAAALWTIVSCGMGFFLGKYILNISYILGICLLLAYFTVAVLLRRYLDRL